MFNLTKSKIQLEALDDTLQRLEDAFQEDSMQKACLSCWEVEPCSCKIPRYWPISHVIGRLSSWI